MWTTGPVHHDLLVFSAASDEYHHEDRDGDPLYHQRNHDRRDPYMSFGPSGSAI